MKLVSKLFLSFALFAHLGQAATVSVESLLESSTRPTMAEVRKVLPLKRDPYIPVTAQFMGKHFDKRVDPPAWTSLLLHHGPKLIANFEKTHPGATWVFLGRDGMAWADLFDAFYISIGQPNRVIRLGISKGSMPGMDDKRWVAYLRSHGIDLDKPGSFVFVDSVSKGNGTQGRRLMAALYADWINRDRNPMLLLNRVNMIGLAVSTFQGTAFDLETKPLQQYLQALFISLLNSSEPIDGENIMDNMRILVFPEANHAANEAGYTHFIGAWHDAFGKIEKSRSGVWEAVPGTIYPSQMLRTVIWVQEQIWNFVNSGACLESVRKQSKFLGYEFPIRRPKVSAPSEMKLKKFRDLLMSREGNSFELNEIDARELAHYKLSPQDYHEFLNYVVTMTQQDPNYMPRDGYIGSDIQKLSRALVGETTKEDCSDYLGKR